MTTNESWGFNLHDHDWKPPALLIRQLGEVVSQGGNYLLNIGPRADGTIPRESLDALREVGSWMRLHGAAIRGASAGPFPHRLPWGFATRRGLTIFLLIDRWPPDGLLRVPLLDRPISAELLGRADWPLVAQPAGPAFELRLPPTAPDAALSVIALQFTAEPRVGDVPPRPRPPIVPQPADGALTLRAADAEIIGDHLALTSGAEPTLGCWTSLDSHPLWRVGLHRGGTFRVALRYAVPRHRQGTLAEIMVGDKVLHFVVDGTGGWGEFRLADAGEVTLQSCAELPVRVLPRNIPVGAVMNLESVVLTPVTGSSGA